MIANQFVLEDCTMRPVRRFGIDSDAMSVLSPAGNPMGTYTASNNEFLLDPAYRTRWSREVVNNVFE